ncbi:hypothetical protein J6G99_05800 [bacterium]|nr:hypothetical protein [bacterium]
MKKILFLLILTLAFCNSSMAFENIVVEEEPPVTTQVEQPKVLQAEVNFDWLDISQAQRQEQIDRYKNLLFSIDKDKIYLTKDEFNRKFSSFRKDKEYKHHYMMTNNGVTEDEDAKYCAFYYKKGTLVMYAIQYKTNPHNAFYYTAFGKLYYVDITSNDYPNFPYYSMQYNRKGQLKSAIYFVSKDIQYMYGPNKEFQGIWYKDKMYNASGKQTLTRSNW